MNCPNCKDGLIVTAEDKTTGWQMLKKCPLCYDARPNPTRFDWLRPMGADDYQTAQGPKEHPLSFAELCEQAAKF